MSRADYDPRGNANVGDVSEPEYGSTLEQIVDWIYGLVRWMRQRDPVTPGDPFTKFATRGWLVQKGVVTEDDVLGNDDDGNTTVTDPPVDFKYVLARDMTPSVTSGCAPLETIQTTAAAPNLTTLNFDSIVAESADFELLMPAGWVGGAFQFRVYWSHASGGSGFGVVWHLEAYAASDGETIAAGYAQEQHVADTGGSANTLYITSESDSMPIEGTAAAEGDLVFCRITRVVSDPRDTLTIDARLHAIRFNLGDAPADFQPVVSSSEAGQKLHFDGSFADSSSASRTVVAHGSISRSTSSKFGSESLAGGSSGYLEIADSASLEFGNYEWSVDYWLYIGSSASLNSTNAVLAKWSVSPNRLSWIIGFDGLRRPIYMVGNGSSYSQTNTCSSAIQLDSWVHCVTSIRKTPTTAYLDFYIDGVCLNCTSGPIESLGSVFDSNAPICIGDTDYNGAPLPVGVLVDEIRIRVGDGNIDYNGSAFTPPTTPYV